MDLSFVLAVLGGGFGAGFVLTAVGAGSLVSFPILLGVGLSPLVANVCNNVGLVPGGLTGAFGYRRELAGHRAPRAPGRRHQRGRRAARRGAAARPAARGFDKVVPWLVLVAATLVGLGPFISSAVRRRAARLGVEVAADREVMGPRLTALSALIGVYGGYFGAAQGVLLVAVLALGLDVPLSAVNGLKNVAVASANVAATRRVRVLRAAGLAGGRADRDRLGRRRLARRPPGPPAAPDGVPGRWSWCSATWWGSSSCSPDPRLSRRPGPAQPTGPLRAPARRPGRAWPSKSLARISRSDSRPATRAITAAIVVMWFSASTKLCVAACAERPADVRGRLRQDRLDLPVRHRRPRPGRPGPRPAYRPARPGCRWRPGGRRSSRAPRSRWRCRPAGRSSSRPRPCPARSGRTTPTAVEASGTLMKPMPRPATISPGIRWVHVGGDGDAAHQEQPERRRRGSPARSGTSSARGWSAGRR